MCLVVIAACAVSSQHLQWFTDLTGENSGHTVCNFLTLPVSARVLGRGASSSPGGYDALDLPSATAFTALADRYRFAFSHLEWLLGMRKEYLGAIFPVLDVGTFGFYSQLFTPGPITNARDIDEQPSDPSYIEYTAGATFAHSFFRNSLSAGCAVAFVESRIEELTGRTVSGSIDLYYSPLKLISGHLYASSFGKPVSYRDREAEPLPVHVGISTLLRPLFKAGPLKQLIDFDIGIGARKTADEALVAGISSQISVGPYFRFRTGYEYPKGQPASIHGLSAGTGITWNAFTLEGAWRYLSKEFGMVWALSLLYEREELKKRTAEDYFTIAMKHYNKKRYYFCTLNARRALRLDPNMWKAHSLISRVKSDILRGKRREIAVIYTGNAQGHFTVPVEEGVPGGFARQASVIAALRGQFPLSLTVEAGNMIVPDMKPRRSFFAGSWLDYISHDALGCGIGELVYGVPKLTKQTSERHRFICSNILATSPEIVRHRIIEKEEYRFFVASYINPWLVPEKQRGFLAEFDPDVLRNAGKECDLRILIAHDTWEGIKKKEPVFAGFDIIICGNLEQRFPSPMKSGDRLILSAGSRGRYVGNLILRFDENRKIIGVENKLIPLQSTIPPDSAVARKISTFTAHAPVKDVPPAGSVQPVEGTFAFTSDRDGRDGIYLKVTDQMAEFPLTRSIADTCDNPVVSFQAGCIACRATAADGCRRLMTMRFDGTEKRYIADSLQVRDASFTPDGSWLYYSAAACGDTVTDIYRVRTEGGPSFPVVSWPEATETAPVFTLDGSSMVFCSDRDGFMQLYLTNPEAELPLRITDEAAGYTAPAFSPDGKQIAYLSDFTNFGGRRDLWIFEREDGTHRRITQRSNVKEFCWLSDSRTIVYTMGAMTDELTAVNVQNFRFYKLVVSDTTKSWHERSPHAMMFGGREYIVYMRYYPDENDRQIYRVRPDGSENTRIVNSEGNDWFPMR